MHMVDVTIESEALGHGALAAESKLENGSFQFLTSICNHADHA